MKFTFLGRIVAVLAILLGALRVTITVIAVQSDNPVALTRAYLGSKSTGYYMDQGIYWIIFGILIGILTEISWSLYSINKSLISFQGNAPQNDTK